MKKITFLLSLVLLIACNPVQEKDATKKNKTLPNENISDLEGTWGLTNYFDTIVGNKELAKYRIQSPTWFAILIKIEKDSLFNFGSMENFHYSLNKTSDTLASLMSDVTGEKWYLIKKEKELLLIQYPHSENIDSTIYRFRKREDLNYFTEKNKDAFIIGKNVTQYFNQELFAGKYINKETNQKIVFEPNGNLIGIDGFDAYEVRNYFGTMHMHKNLDVITFKNKTKSKQYHWVFLDNQLSLTEFVVEQITRNGKTENGDYFVLGKEKMILEKQ